MLAQWLLAVDIKKAYSVGRVMFRQGAVATGVVCMMRAGEMESRQFTAVLKLAEA